MFLKEVNIIIFIKINVGVVVCVGIIVISGEKRLFRVNRIVIIIDVKFVWLFVLIFAVFFI